MSLSVHHRLCERYLRVDLAGRPSLAGFLCAIDSIRRCRGTWRTRNLLIDLRKVQDAPSLNVPAMLGEQLLRELPDVLRIGCIEPADAGWDCRHFEPGIRFFASEAEALRWIAVAARPEADSPPAATSAKPQPSVLGRLVGLFGHHAAVSGKMANS